MKLRKILGDIAVRDNGNGFTARHLGKTATSTSSGSHAMNALLEKIYGKSVFYYCQVDFKWLSSAGGKPTEIYNAISEDRP